MFTDDVKPQKQETAGKREMEVKHKRRRHRQTVATTLAQPQTQEREMINIGGQWTDSYHPSYSSAP